MLPREILYCQQHSLFFQNRIIDITGIVFPKITLLLQNFFVPKSTLCDDLHQLYLADPYFHSPGHVDLLLGSNVVPSILLDGVKDVCNFLIAQATIFGWVISGPIDIQICSLFSIQTIEISKDPTSHHLKQFEIQMDVTSYSFHLRTPIDLNYTYVHLDLTH